MRFEHSSILHFTLSRKWADTLWTLLHQVGPRSTSPYLRAYRLERVQADLDGDTPTHKHKRTSNNKHPSRFTRQVGKVGPEARTSHLNFRNFYVPLTLFASLPDEHRRLRLSGCRKSYSWFAFLLRRRCIVSGPSRHLGPKRFCGSTRD
jgi:hypothetical protein